MWEVVLPFTHGQTLYTVLSLFLLYSFVGWMVESLYMSLCNKKLTNRGFIRGPFCPIYAMGELVVYNLLYPFSNNYIFLFIAGTLLATSIELLTAKIMIRFLGYVWWDYTNKPLNYKGIICLESTLAWGIYTIIEFSFLHAFMLSIVYKMSIPINKFIIIFTIVYYIIDFVFSVNNVVKGDVTVQENNIMTVTSKDN